MRFLLVAGLAVMVAGCAGIDPDKEYPKESFEVPLGYQEVYRRADAQPRKCISNFETTGNIYTDNETGVVRVSVPKSHYSGNESLRVNIKAIDASRSSVTIVVSDWAVFDREQIVAMRRSIETGESVCRKPPQGK